MLVTSAYIVIEIEIHVLPRIYSLLNVYHSNAEFNLLLK